VIQRGGTALLQLEFHWNEHPHRYRHPIAAGRVKTPAPYGFLGRLIQHGMPRGALDLDFIYPSLLGNTHFEERCPLDAPPSGGLRILGLHLVATERASRSTATAPTATITAAS